MKSFIFLCCLSLSINCIAQNVGINITIPEERLHILDNTNTKLLLETTTGTAFYATDAPSNGGIVFRSSGIDRAYLFYSAASNTMTASVGPNGWALNSSGDFRVKERIYSLNDLRMDAQESVTIEANGAIIKIDPSGNIEIQGSSVSVQAQDNLSLSATNINIDAQNDLSITSGGSTNITSGENLEVTASNNIEMTANSDIAINTTNLSATVSKLTNITSGVGVSISSLGNLLLDANNDATFSIGGNYSLSVGDDFGAMIGRDLNTSVGRNQVSTVSLSSIVNALRITSNATSLNSIQGSSIKFNGGNKAFARVGDVVLLSNGITGSIISGSSEVSGN